MNIDVEKIIKYAGRGMYKRGLQYFKEGRVTLDDVQKEQFHATVNGSHPYSVFVQKQDDKIIATCTCPYWTTCKHVVAAMLKAKAYYEKNKQKFNDGSEHPHWRDFFNKIYEERETVHVPASQYMQKWQVVYIFNFDRESWSISPKKAYVKKNGTLGRRIHVGDFNSRDFTVEFAPNDPIIIPYLERFDDNSNSFYNYKYYSSYRSGDSDIYHFKYGSRIGPLFELLKKSALHFEGSNAVLDSIIIREETCSIDIELIDQEAEYQLCPFVILNDKKFPLDQKFRILTERPIWLLGGNSLYQVTNLENAELLIPFTKNNIIVKIPKEEFPKFLEQIYPRVNASTPIPMPESLPMRTISELTENRIYLREGSNHLEVYLCFAYGNHEIDFHDPRPQLYKQQENDIVFIVRDISGEQKVWQSLSATGLRSNLPSGLKIIDSKALDWMFDKLPVLVQDGFKVFGQSTLKKYKVRSGEPNIRIAISSNIDWFDLNMEIDFEGIVLSLKELKKSLSHQRRLVRLSDGSVARLPEEWYVRFQHLFNFTDTREEKIKVARFHATLIDMLFDQTVSKDTDQEFRDSLVKLKNFNGIRTREVPVVLQGILRPYQKAGYDWMYFLQDYFFGGILADDMGLGKTLQTLSLLLRQKESGNKMPSLIVCPTSVVFNWEREVQKFTPTLRTHIHTGLERSRNTNRFYDFDIILTSYGVMRRDISFLKEFRFHYIILDESQKIKNPQSQTAKASRLLTADYRLTLTGTPVENNTVELWSQFAFLNPGLLGSLPYFKRAFSNPIEKKGENDKVDFLKQMIFPFILRRTKEGVERELPPKVEQTLFCTMNPAQDKLYVYWRDYYRALILQKVEEEGVIKARMNVLEGLVKLRQIACHPYLVDKSVEEDSGKFELLKELVDEILAEKHKILLFSQFVKMLRLIRTYLDGQHIPYEYLDGHTIHRERCVNRFQNDEDVRIFLISLKAGGTGLNLTAADYVLHYDPWWNPAVEVQATDRAHRIGQNKKVFVYRLITKDSVEEKILQLQSKKSHLISNLITTDSSFFKSLTKADIEILFS
jgi:non-specific serine/threonine protein kinase